MQNNVTDCAVVVIGFLNTSYTVVESDRVINIQVGTVQGALHIQRPVIIELSTRDISTDG